jgi:glyoxylate/hydroxypyruvate reductase
MTTVLVHAGRDGPQWQAQFARIAPDLHSVAWPDAIEAERVDYIACWSPPVNFFGAYPRVKAIFALGAGVDKLLSRPDFPAHVSLVRLTDAGMAEQMLEYALYGVLSYQRRMPAYAAQQMRAEWRKHPPRSRGEVRVSVLGLGAIGGVIAQGIAALGYAVGGWSRHPRSLDGVRCVSGDESLTTLLERSDVLVNVLPSTAQTRRLLNHERLSRLPRGAYVVNCSRGDQLDAQALVTLLDQAHLSGALLDVFDAEPLPPDSPLWRHPGIQITPHVAGTTLIEPSVAQIVAKIRDLESGIAVAGVVQPERAY